VFRIQRADEGTVKVKYGYKYLNLTVNFLAEFYVNMARERRRLPVDVLSVASIPVPGAPPGCVGD
jgi:hypothetical protein